MTECSLRGSRAALGGERGRSCHRARVHLDIGDVERENTFTASRDLRPIRRERLWAREVPDDRNDAVARFQVLHDASRVGGEVAGAPAVESRARESAAAAWG